MTWWDASIYARAGKQVRRRAWLTDPARFDWQVVFVRGAGTTRAVAVLRSGGADAVVTPSVFSQEEFLADDWEPNYDV